MGGNANLLWCWGQQTGFSLVLACRLEFHLLTQSGILSITECPGKESWNWTDPKLYEYPWALPSGLLKLQEYSLFKIWEIVPQLRGIWIFYLVRSLEGNMKILVLNCISARDFHLFLLIIQNLEQLSQSFPTIFLTYFCYFLCVGGSLSPFPYNVLCTKKVFKIVLKLWPELTIKG